MIVMVETTDNSNNDEEILKIIYDNEKELKDYIDEINKRLTE